MIGNLRVPERIYEDRKNRIKHLIKHLIELDAPKIIIHREIMCLLRSFERRTLREWLFDLRIRYAPHWLMLIIDREYRQFDREDRELEKPCVSCGEITDQICENCEAPLCYDCDSKAYHDVLTCKDEAGCEKRCAVNEAKA